MAMAYHIREMRERTGLSQAKFSKKFGIPPITLQSWEAGRREPPAYVLGMIEKLLEYESRYEKGGNGHEKKD
mgnify:CR=1 FL=1